MRIISKICCGIIGAATLVSSSSVFATIIGAGSLTINAPGYNAADGYDQAGPYSVTALTPATGPNPGSGFETFCIGTQIDYSPGSTYYYQISDVVQPSGTGGVGPPGYVTWGTAWLYSQYRAGALGDGSASDTLNNALQAAIWSLQQQSLAGISFGTAGLNITDENNFLADAAAAAAADHVSSDTNNANGAFGVYALNMSTSSSYASGDWVQPQLVMVPEPATVIAGLLLLLPLGASAFRIIRSRKTPVV